MTVARIDEIRAQLRERPRRWLVTGAAGFIGSHLVHELLSLGQYVVGLDNFATGSRKNLEEASAHAPDASRLWQFIEGDIREPRACEQAIKNADIVLHQAALGSVPRSIEDPVSTHQVNVDGFVNVVLAARAAGCGTVVYASSSSVYGDDENLPKQEDTVGRPLSPYAASKRTNEIYAAAYSRAYGLQILGLRYFNVVGARQSPDGPYAAVVPRWIARLARGQRAVIYGDGSTSRDFCPVENTVDANLLAACTAERLSGRVYNVAVGSRTTLTALHELVRDTLACRGAPCADLEPIYEDFRPGDIHHSHADTTRARQDLGYLPRLTLPVCIEQTIDWFMALT